MWESAVGHYLLSLANISQTCLDSLGYYLTRNCTVSIHSGHTSIKYIIFIFERSVERFYGHQHM